MKEPSSLNRSGSSFTMGILSTWESFWFSRQQAVDRGAPRRVAAHHFGLKRIDTWGEATAVDRYAMFDFLEPGSHGAEPPLAQVTEMTDFIGAHHGVELLGEVRLLGIGSQHCHRTPWSGWPTRAGGEDGWKSFDQSGEIGGLGGRGGIVAGAVSADQIGVHDIETALVEG